MEDFLDWYLGNPYNLQQLWIVRGPSGSGKSYIAKTLVSKENIFSADDFWGETYKEYRANWNPEKLYTAHKQCENKVRKAMQERKTPIVVDNTHIRLSDIVPYIGMAIQYGYKVGIKEPESPWWLNDIAPYLHNKTKYAEQLEKGANILFERNQHGVPLETIKKMLLRWRSNIKAEDILLSFLRKK